MILNFRWILLGFLIPVIIFVIVIIIINLLQNKRPTWLPIKLRTWEFLPIPLRSLRPYDTIVQKLRKLFLRYICVCKCCCNKNKINKVIPVFDECQLQVISDNTNDSNMLLKEQEILKV